MMASISATILNSIGDKGSPCLSPFEVWKYLPTSSLTLMATLPPDKKGFDQSTPLSRKTFHSECLLKDRPLDLVIGFLKIKLQNYPVQLLGMQFVNHFVQGDDSI
jgi:hypothetical protein